MKSIDTDEVWASRILYEKPYTILYDETDERGLNKILTVNPLFKIPENTILLDITGCYQDIPINYSYDFIFRSDNIEDCDSTIAIIKKVYAFGAKEIDQIPSKWSVIALIEFPNGIPSLIKNKKINDPLYLCSKNLWKDLVKIIP
ncbi:hypothetical protein [Flavobacterium sp. N502540]|uniref:hypothetical protein n=1 Tax=Flavobacterium sp. N502540 TaxID=2986838 RepID=UPI00222559C1|nr:hypothetical protein [Flavobacterium sp. N502540]